MRTKLDETMQQFCKEFDLKYIMKFSDDLSQQDIVLYNFFFDGHAVKIIDEFKEDFLSGHNPLHIMQKIKKKSLRSTAGVGEIEKEGVERIKKFILCVETFKKSSDVGLDSKYDKLIAVSRVHSYYLHELKRLVNLIDHHNLIGTLPIVPPPTFFVLFGHSKRFQLMIHECIHFILKQNKVTFYGEGISPLDEGLAVFLHFKFNRDNWTYKHNYFHGPTKQYRLWASYFNREFGLLDKDKIIPAIKEKSGDELLSGMKEFLKSKFNKHHLLD